MDFPSPYLAIRNWDKYQHLQHGAAAPWFKVYAKILDDPEILEWSLAEIGVWVLLLALRSRIGRNLPNDPGKLVRMLALSRNKRATAVRLIIQRISDGLLIPTNQQIGYESSGTAPEQTEERAAKPTEERSPKCRSKPKQEPLALPPWIDPVVWAAFKEMRAKIRKPMTRYAEERIIAKVSKLRDGGDDPNEVLDQSTEHSWQGVFSPKGDHYVNREKKFDVE